MKTKIEYIKELEQGDVLMQQELTFPEYAEQLKDFQDIVCKMVAGEAYYEGMRADEAAFLLESEAKRKGLRWEAAVQNGIRTMKNLSKEIAITMAGINSERRVERKLASLTRPNTRVFRNVSVSDGQTQTELDAVVLTDAAIIILEIKSVKSDLTLTRDGRMVFSGNECYDNMPLCKKMEQKRKLLRKHLESQLLVWGLDIPVFVESYIVFSAPKGQFIHIDDCYHQEKYCFDTGIKKTIENYSGCVNYTKAALEQLGDAVSELKTNEKRFKKKLDFDQIRQSIAEAMVVLREKKVEERAAEPADVFENADTVNSEEKTKKTSKYAAVGIATVGLLLLSGLGAVLGRKIHRS